ncbi:HEAT repeat domain-containing protein [Pedobacter sp.]|uniref:HEAT repeat domain-containing protein n=1 Tax=Pedobacter sp. TaxID=1411316 RepID=UPI003D7F3105
MNDPIKDFVERHREEFDHLDAPVFKLDQLKPKFQPTPEVRKRSFSILNGNKWLVAASILVTLTCAWFFFYQRDGKKPEVQLAGQNTKSSPKKVVDADSARTEIAPSVAARMEQQAKQEAPEMKKKAPEIITPAPARFAKLKDSTSASRRLLAILEIEETGKIDRKVIDMLALTLNHDGNTNVRLAALSLMQKYSDNEHVSALLVSSLYAQGDPIVQLGLVTTLGKMKNIEITDKLESLVNSPETFAAVRDEAYRILLNQNRL